MRKILMLAASGLFATGSVTAVFACACHLGRGVRFERTSRAAHPASVLIYVSPQTGKSTLSSLQLQAILKQAGHQLENVGDKARLEQQIKSGKFDLVLAEYDDAVAMADTVKAASPNEVIIPVMAKAQKAQYSVASKQFTYVVKSMSDPAEYLTRIEQAMKARSGAGVRASVRGLDTATSLTYSAD